MGTTHSKPVDVSKMIGYTDLVSEDEPQQNDEMALILRKSQ